MNLKELVTKPQKLTSGHRTCQGCGLPIVARSILRATDKPVVVACATGCMEVTTTIYPYSSWNVPWIHSAFENAAATIAGVESAYQALKKKDKVGDIKFVAFAGDGGSYDIGLQSLSGALERGHDCLYVCYDNQAYMNTGIQRSSATPKGAATTTTPAGKVRQGKEEFRKDLTKIVVSHNIPYVAQASIYHWADLHNKAKKAFETKGPAFINILSPCILGWRYPSHMTMEIAKLAVETCFWPIYEVEQGKYKLNYQPSKKLPVTDFFKPQGRFKHLFKPQNRKILEEIQQEVDRRWQELQKLCKL